MADPSVQLNYMRSLDAWDSMAPKTKNGFPNDNGNTLRGSFTSLVNQLSVSVIHLADVHGFSLLPILKRTFMICWMRSDFYHLSISHLQTQQLCDPNVILDCLCTLRGLVIFH